MSDSVCLSEIPVGSYFRTSLFGIILQKSDEMLVGQIGCYTQFGQLIYYSKDKLVIPETSKFFA